MADSARSAARRYLAQHNVLTLACSGPLGLWAAAVFYASDEFDLIFLSAANTRHARNIAANGHVAATVQQDYASWPAIQGVQLEGDVTLLAEQARDDAIAHYLAKYPAVAADPQLQPALRRVNWYRIRPTLLYFIDNSRGFGHRDLIIGTV